MSTLTSSRRAPKSGKTTSLVIFVHGYGADANDLISLADPFSEPMPDTVFIAPNAPHKCQMNPMGFEWFPIPWIDGSSPEVALAGMHASLDQLDTWLSATIKAEEVTPAQTLLLGFSQGTMMSLQLAPRRQDALAGVVGFSGRLWDPDSLKADLKSKPPVLLIHGDMDEVVPPSSLPEAADALTENGFEVYTHISKGMGHGIAPDGLGLAFNFMKEKLNI